MYGRTVQTTEDLYFDIVTAASWRVIPCFDRLCVFVSLFAPIPQGQTGKGGWQLDPVLVKLKLHLRGGNATIFRLVIH